MVRGVKFGVFDLDYSTGELRKCGIRVRLPRQSTEVLRLLVDRPGEVVTREEIQRTLWPNGEVVEFEHSINAAVWRLREVLGESATAPHMIETIAGRGYRLLVPVQALGNGSLPAEPNISHEQRGRSGTRNPTAVATTLTAAGIGLLAVLYWTFPLLGHRIGGEQWVAEEPGSRPLLSQLAEQMFPAWSPDGKSLAYIGGTGPLDRRLMVHTIGSLATSTPEDGGLALAERQFPFWSADSHSLYYFSRQRLGPALYRVPIGGGKPSLVRERTVAAAASPDGMALASLSYSADGAWRIWTASPPDAQWEPYAPEPFAAAAILQWPNLSFSPDGSRILVVVNLPAAGPSYFLLPWPRGPARSVFRAGLGRGAIPRLSWLPDSRHVTFVRGGELFIGDTGTGRFWRTGTVAPHAAHSTLSPDGTRLAYQFTLSHTDVVAVPLDGGAPRTLVGTLRLEEQAACSPAADQLVYLTDRRNRWEIWLAGLDGKWAHPLLADTEPRYSPSAGVPVFSRDGHMIAYRLGLNAALSGIVVTPAAGAGKSHVVVQAPIALAPSWSPDSRWIVYLELVGSSYRLMKVRSMEEQPPVQLAVSFRSLAPPVAMLPEWSPAGDWIAYADEEGLLALVSPDGLRRKPLGGSGPVAWSARGRSLYQVRYAERAVFEVDPSSGHARMVRDLGPLLLPYATEEPGRRVSLTRDGKSLVYSVVRPREEIWIREGIRRNHSLTGSLANWLSRFGK